MVPLKDSFQEKLHKKSAELQNSTFGCVKQSIANILHQVKHEDFYVELAQLAKSANADSSFQDENLTTKFENECWTQWSNTCFSEYDKSTVLHLFKCLVRLDHGEDIAAAYFRSGISRTILFHVSTVFQKDAKLKELILKTFSYSKFKLMKDIMIDLAEKEDFAENTKYIKDPYTFAKIF